MQILESNDLVDSLKSHIAILNEHGKIIAVNKSWEEFGTENGLKIDCIECNYIEISENADGEDAETGKLMADGIRQVLLGSVAEFTLVYPCHSSDKKRWFNAIVTPFIRNSKIGVIICHTDITQIKMAKEILKDKLKEISSYKLALIESSIITITDNHGAIVYLNNNFSESTGYYISELLGQDHRIINSGFHTKEFMKKMWDTILGGKIWKGEVNNKTKSGKEFWLDMTIVPFLDENGTIYQFVSVSKDITYLKTVVHEQETLNMELRLLSAHLQNAREEERIKMAREIHDELGQQLTAIKINIDWIYHKGENNLLELKRKAEASLQIVNETIRSVKGIVADLRPALLDDLGLEAAIEFYVEEFAKRTGILCSYESSILDAEYSFHVNITLYRICQESLTNVASHARATKVCITLYENDDSIILEIIDNGIGIKEKDLSKANSFGLIGMKERAGILGGKFEITPFLPHGTNVTVQIPIV